MKTLEEAELEDDILSMLICLKTSNYQRDHIQQHAEKLYVDAKRIWKKEN